MKRKQILSLLLALLMLFSVLPLPAFAETDGLDAAERDTEESFGWLELNDSLPDETEQGNRKKAHRRLIRKMIPGCQKMRTIQKKHFSRKILLTNRKKSRFPLRMKIPLMLLRRMIRKKTKMKVLLTMIPTKTICLRKNRNRM